jgi:protein TonB
MFIRLGDPPKYPKAALMNEETGTVAMGFLVATDGKVIESKVEKSSGSKSLDKAALSALSLCKFKPGNKDGKPEQLWAKLDFVWKLE